MCFINLKNPLTIEHSSPCDCGQQAHSCGKLDVSPFDVDCDFSLLYPSTLYQDFSPLSFPKGFDTVDTVDTLDNIPAVADTLALNVDKKVTKTKHEQDIVAKRQKNKEAARRSRERKVKLVEDLESKLDAAEKKVVDLGMKLVYAESEKNQALQRESGLVKRISELEKQLSEAHRLLVKQAH